MSPKPYGISAFCLLVTYTKAFAKQNEHGTDNCCVSLLGQPTKHGEYRNLDAEISL